MFEKEAKEYAHEHCCDSCKNLQARYRKVYQDGAEIGYNKAMNEAKGIIKDLLHCLPKENIEGVYEVAEETEQFLSEVEK